MPHDQRRRRRPGIVGLATVRGRSMLPLLHPGDVLLVRYVDEAQQARLVPGRLVVVRLPPDTDGMPRPIAVKRLAGPAPDGEPGWWVERDNPNEGIDSWTVGVIPADQVLGVVLTRLWPLRLPARMWARRRGLWRPTR